MSQKNTTYLINEGSILASEPVQDQSINILRYRDPDDQPYNIMINRATLKKEQTMEDFCSDQCTKMQRNVPGFEVTGKNLTHEIGPAKLPVLQTANKYLENGGWVHQVMSIVMLPRHPTRNPDMTGLLIFTLGANGEFTNAQRKHYVAIINSFIPEEVPQNL